VQLTRFQGLESLDGDQRARDCKFGRMVGQNVAQARYLAALVDAARD
jgi:hypothetical protein